MRTERHSGSQAALSPTLDVFDRALRSEVHPEDWQNPRPQNPYNLVVIGAGTAGLVAAAGAAGLGARVALIERSLMGGDCLNTGCVPSKAMIAAARVAASARDSAEFGINAHQPPEVSFAAVMERMRRLRSEISHHDSAERFRKLGVDVFFGQATFADADTIRVGDTLLRFRKALIATGARAAMPAIPGLSKVPWLSNETLFSLTELPPRLGIIGAGPIGCEMAQTFARLGSRVTLFESAHGVLPREDRDAAAIVQSSLQQDGVRVVCCGRDMRVTTSEIGGTSEIVLTVHSHEQTQQHCVDQLLVSTGRQPNIEQLGLGAAGVEASEKGITVNDRLQTTNSAIYAAGDVCSRFQFTHAADAMARIVIRNALFYGRTRVSALVMPWCTYTSPEIAHTGLYEHEAEAQGIRTQTFVQPLQENDRAVLEGQSSGFVKVHVRSGTDKIVGATIVGNHAGDMISELTLAITQGIGLRKIGEVIHPYPTQAEAIRRLGDHYNRTRLTPFIQSLFRFWLRWTRR